MEARAGGRQRLRDQVAGADRVLAVTPEYNGTMPAVLNNAIDWLSRPYGADALRGKPFAALGATPTRSAASGRTRTHAARPTVAGAEWSPTSRSPSRPSTAATSWRTPSSSAGSSAPWTLLVEHRVEAQRRRVTRWQA